MVKKKSNVNTKVVPEIKGNKAIQKNKNKNKKATNRFPSKSTRGNKVNPFEFRTTSKSKRSDLKTTRDPSKTNHSTLTRSRSQKKREETLGIEHSRRNIGNEFHDKRWGLKEDIPEEDRNLMLFQKQKMKEWREKEGGTARDDEILTHEGYDIDFEGLKKWREIERDDEEEEEEEDTFGGLRRKLKSEMGEEEAITGKRSKELIMKEIIAKSKYFKFQRFQEKEEKNRKLSQVDDDFREVATLLGHGNLYFKKKQEEQAKPEIQTEGAKEEKEAEKDKEGEEIEGDNSAEESENDQIEEGVAKEEASDEEDAEQGEGEEEEEGKEQIVAKEEGKAESEQEGEEEEEDEGSGEYEEPKVEPVNDKKKQEKPQLPKGIPKPPEDDDDFDRLLREMTNEPRAQPTDPLQTPEELAKAQKEKLEQLELLRIRRMGEEGQPPLPGNQLSEETTLPTEGGDDLNDASLLVKNKYKKEKQKKKKSKKEKEKERAEEEVEDDEEEEGDQQGDSGEEENYKEALEEAEPTLPLTGDLPFVYEFPKQYGDFAALLAAQSIKRKQLIIKRIIACHHHSLNEENKSKMKILFGYLVEYLQKNSIQRSLEIQDRLELYDILHKAIYDLAHQIPAESSLFIRKKITQLFYKKNNLDFQDMILLQIVYHVWPASDRHHVIVTLVFLLFGKYFTETTFGSEEDLLLGLFMATLFINYLKPAKRFAPEPYLFLCGIVKAFVENWKKAVYSTKEKDTQNTPSNDLPHDSVISKSIKSIQLDLVKIEDWSSLPQLEEIPTFNILSDFSKIEKDDAHKLAVLKLALVILKEYISIYNEEEQMIGFTPLLIQTLNLVKDIESITVLPKKIGELLGSIKKLASERITQASKNRIPLHLFDIPLKPLPEFTPNIKMEIGRNSRIKDPSKNANEVNRLKRKLKSEKKGAERELKLDTKFMARKRAEERKERDQEKTEKRRKVNTWLEDQQREAKKERREKKKSIF